MGHRHDEDEDEQIPFSLHGADGTDHRIVVTSAKRQWLDEHLRRQWRRPPTPAESDRFLADFIREEILYREALALGLDHDDLVVRRRLVQKMEMLAIRDTDTISESDLMDHYLDHRADYILPGSISFRQVFFSTAVRGQGARPAALAALAHLRETGALDETHRGDPAPVPAEVNDWTPSMAEARFGPDFSHAVFELVQGTWSGPIASPYGQHLVFVGRRSAARVPDFGEVADRVATNLDTERRAGALDRFYATVRNTYQVEIEPPGDDSPSPSFDDPRPHDHLERTPA